MGAEYRTDQTIPGVIIETFDPDHATDPDRLYKVVIK
jgi:hypothetical protein